MSNIASILSSHNLNVNNLFKTETYGCNCRAKESCPLQNLYLTPKIIYRADVKSNTNCKAKFYFELTESPFKYRFGNHTGDFKHKMYSKCTDLSKYIWNLKEKGINAIVKWSMLRKFTAVQKYIKIVFYRKILYH